MNHFYRAGTARYIIYLFTTLASLPLCTGHANAQSCPLNSTTSLTAYPNTYYPAAQTNVGAGSHSITLGAVTYGTTPISSGDVILIIQMQGAQINSTNTSAYGSGGTTGSGYLNNGNLIAGNMEYLIASNNVPLTGGTLNTTTNFVKSYKNTPFGTDGQYTYQVIRIPSYYKVKLSANVTAPRWDGSTGGLIMIYATDSIIMNGKTIDASGLGFRGGGGRNFNGSGGGSSADYITPASSNANGGKGEGIAGTPKYLNNNNAFLDVSTYEGYPNGSYGKGAPGNAGGGGTDGNPASNNDENTGGGGGGNGGAGGSGGKAWHSAIASGGKSGALFNQVSPSRLVMGGGGGAGTTNNGTGDPGNGFASSGSAGGGIIILIANTIAGTGKILASGSTANSTVKNDGSGGGGAGGSILLFTKIGNMNNITVTAKGGTGGSNQGNGGDAHGPGGGGGGGIIYTNAPIAALSSVAAGKAGWTSGNSDNYGAAAGVDGMMNTTIAQSQTPPFPLTCVVLAIKFLDITATAEAGVATVHWVVSGETDTKEYLVEKSNDGSNFSVIGHTPYKYAPASGNSYTYTDNNAASPQGLLYYRVKEVDFSGAYLYSEVVTVRTSGIGGKISIYPNPVHSSATISATALSAGTLNLQLWDSKGSLLLQQPWQVAAGPNTVSLYIFSKLPNGVYVLQCSDGTSTQQIKVLVDH